MNEISLNLCLFLYLDRDGFSKILIILELELRIDSKIAAV
jgi:hypothetical protein